MRRKSWSVAAHSIFSGDGLLCRSTRLARSVKFVLNSLTIGKTPVATSRYSDFTRRPEHAEAEKHHKDRDTAQDVGPAYDNSERKSGKKQKR